MWGAPPAQGAQGAVGAGQDDGGLIWVPLGDGLAHPSQQAGQQARPAAVPETLPFAPPLGLQAAGAPAAALNGFQQLDAALLQPLPSLPMPSADASAGGTGQPAGASSAATTEAVDKQAVAREKNRLAQRRFREKERQKVAEAEAQADAMRRQLSQLRLENERLQLEQTLLEKLLVVRDAILSVVVQLDTLPPSQQQQGQAAHAVQAAWQPPGLGASGSTAAPAGPSATALLEDPAALQAASQQLAFALGELPSLEQMEAMIGQLAGDSGSEGGASSGNSGSSSSAAGSQAAATVAAANGSPETVLLPPPAATVGAAAASGVVVESSRLKEIVPLPCPAAEKEVQNIEDVESLLAYWQQWRQQLRELFQEAQASQFADQDRMDELVAHQQEFVRVFWAACHVRPQLFNVFLARCLPPPGVDASAQWTLIAHESLPLISDGEVAAFRQAMQRYTKRVAIAAVGVRPWVQRLQAVVAAQRSSSGSMSQLAGQHTQVREVVSRMQHACTEQYMAYMAFLGELSASISHTLRALWHSSSDPFAPDHPAIVSEILRLHQQRQRQQLAAPAPAAAPV